MKRPGLRTNKPNHTCPRSLSKFACPRTCAEELTGRSGYNCDAIGTTANSMTPLRSAEGTLRHTLIFNMCKEWSSNHVFLCFVVKLGNCDGSDGLAGTHCSRGESNSSLRVRGFALSTWDLNFRVSLLAWLTLLVERGALDSSPQVFLLSATARTDPPCGPGPTRRAQRPCSCGMQDNRLPSSGYWAQAGHGALPSTSQAAGTAAESIAGRERLRESMGSAAGGITGSPDCKRARHLSEVRGGEGQIRTNGAAGGGHGSGSHLTASQQEFISGDAVRGAGLMPPMSGSTHVPPGAVVERQVDVVRHPTRTSGKTVFLAQEVARTMVQQRRVDALAHLLCCWDRVDLSYGSSAEWFLFCWFPVGLVA